ncbi:TRAP transporter large permease subunit [Treponema sp. OMZ 855]|uniref:TRAP transporter large permease subunit n=1 Tax=Treponema sp. OMZ 855 TaxID=1643512 RepID=UPI0020A2D08B|nr:TRAP transporter large permease subunit [Treponema sp. OMZ 855]UTC51500.1 TRAP transporter large permease subunit [Treponema sp. OMZ 855]
MRKTVNIFVLFLVGILVVLPIIFFFISDVGGIPVLDGERLVIHTVFIFACFAGMITSADHKQLNIEVFNLKLSDRLKTIVSQINNGITAAVLTAIFFACFPNILVVIDASDLLWGLPVRFIFAALPLMFFAQLFLCFKKRGSLVSSLVGLAAGLFISSGSIAVIVYTLLEKDIPFFTACASFWQSLSAPLMLPLILGLIAAALFGLPLFIVLLGITYTAFSQGGGYVDVIPLEMYHILTDTSIAAIPLFTIAGCLLAEGSAGKRLMELVRNSVGWIRGGVVIASVLVLTFFTTFTGASGVTILALGPLISVILTGNGYSKDDSESLITASGSLGILFPPSMAIIIFGVTNIMTIDIFDVFKGAILPGLLLTLSMIVIGVIRDRSKARIPFSWAVLKTAFFGSFFELLLPVFIIVLYFSGLFSLLQTAAFTVLYTCVLEVVIRRDFSWKTAAAFVLKSIPVAGGVLIIIGAAKGLAYYLIDANIPAILTDIVQTYIHSKYVFLLLLNVLLLFVGCIMDLYSAILVVSPLIMPIAESFGIHPIHTAVIFLMNLALGFLTPPIGMDLFIASYTFNKPIVKIVKNILPFLGIQSIILLLVTYIPWLTTALLR